MRQFVCVYLPLSGWSLQQRPQDQPKPLANDDVIQMVSMRLLDDVIIV